MRTPSCDVPDFRFANLGGIFGTPQRIYEMADWILARFSGGIITPGDPAPNDQACLHQYVLKGLVRTGSVPHLDCGHIFFPMWSVWEPHVYAYLHLEKRSTVWPAVFHTNGGYPACLSTYVTTWQGVRMRNCGSDHTTSPVFMQAM